MGMEDSLEDMFGKQKEEVPMKPEERKALWQRFLETNLSGRKFEIGNTAGDMHRIYAIIDRVYKRENGEIVLDVRDVNVIDDLGREVENPHPDIKRFILEDGDDAEPPKFSGDKAIILSSGARYFEDSQNDPFDYGETLFFGMIE